MKKIKNIIPFLLIIGTLLYSCKKKAVDEEIIPPVLINKSAGVLVIENGANRFDPGYSGVYTAYVVDINGKRIDVAGVTWSSTNQSVVSVAGNMISALGEGITTLKASVIYNGVLLTASVPIIISTPSFFTVVPGAVLWSPEAGPIYLDAFYIGSGNPGTYTFTSSAPSIATVSSSGVLTLLKPGECFITVTAPGLDGQPTVVIPIISYGDIAFDLPVSRVAISPSKADLFIGEQLDFSAKAYNGSNQEVSSTFAWELSNDTIASIDANGKFTAIHAGVTKVKVFSQGILSEVEVFIYPHKVIEVTPFAASISPSRSKQFYAQTYLVSKSGASYSLTPTSNPVDLKWEIPSFGIPSLDIATVNTTGFVTMKSTASVGMFAVLGAYSPSDLDLEPGTVLIEVGNCDCGNGTGVAAIIPLQTVFTLSLLSSPMDQIQANPIPSGLPLHFCSQDPFVVSVDSFGNIMGLSPGTASITICDGLVEATITVNVTL